MEKINLTAEEIALQKMRHYCAYQDRCHQEVRTRLLELKIYGEALEAIISALITEKFLNEERFARSFARGKFRIKNWGKIKIKQELKKRNISDYCIKKAMEEIDEEDYFARLYKLMEKKITTEKEQDEFKLKGRLARYAIGKGYESPLVWQVLKDFF